MQAVWERRLQIEAEHPRQNSHSVASSINTLAAALKAAGLEETLQRKERLTRCTNSYSVVC